MLTRTDQITAAAIRVRGVVQGVGFRPTVWRLAHGLGLRGRVWNDADGVMIHVWGSTGSIEQLITELQGRPPPLARIDAIERSELAGDCDTHTFEITASHEGAAHTDIAADAASCPACLADILDPKNRRFGYALTNCTHCGPRLSIIRAIPYDRAHTSMAEFSMCPVCQAEYDNPADRRFQAQPNACPLCGPELRFEDGKAQVIAGDALELAADQIRAGGIVAVKGIGGFHLACDALNEAAVARLRDRKRRYHKPFALMAGDIDQIARHARISEAEEQLLESSAAPVVLLAARADHGMAASVAPDQQRLGFMLPYTPLHHLLMRRLAGPIVLTSGNISDEPQCTGNDEAKARLAGIADGFLLHDREIINRLDDSVVQLAAARPRLIRRARGYAPEAVRLPKGFEQTGRILAMGGELKGSFCLLGEGKAVLSQHMGDLEHAAALRDYRKNLTLYRQLFDFSPECIAVDLHLDYAPTALGRALAAEKQLAVVAVQHHHAHIAACMAEHHLLIDSQVLGVALDGLGFDGKGAIWGGEFLLAGYTNFQRLGSLAAIPIPGGAQAIREPWRNAYAHLQAVGWPEIRRHFADTGIVRLLKQKPLAVLDRMLEKGLNSPPASSAGRLFDAVAAVLGLHAEAVSHEGQAAMALEALAGPAFAAERCHGYPVEISDLNGLAVIGWRPLWLTLLADLDRDVDKAVIAARFHHGLIAAVSGLAARLAEEHDTQHIVLGGGSFQNQLLLEGVIEAPALASLTVLAPERLPANDGGLCFGQAVVAAARRIAGR